MLLREGRITLAHYHQPFKQTPNQAKEGLWRSFLKQSLSNQLHFNAQCHGLTVHVWFQKSKRPFSIEMWPRPQRAPNIGPKVWYICTPSNDMCYWTGVRKILEFKNPKLSPTSLLSSRRRWRGPIYLYKSPIYQPPIHTTPVFLTLLVFTPIAVM